MTSGAGDKGSAANMLRKAGEVVGSMCRCLVSHSARRGPTFNACLSAGTDPGSILHINLRPVPRFSGGVKVFCYTGVGGESSEFGEGPPREGSASGGGRSAFKGELGRPQRNQK